MALEHGQELNLEAFTRVSLGAFSRDSPVCIAEHSRRQRNCRATGREAERSHDGREVPPYSRPTATTDPQQHADAATNPQSQGGGMGRNTQAHVRDIQAHVRQSSGYRALGRAHAHMQAWSVGQLSTVTCNAKNQNQLRHRHSRCSLPDLIDTSTLGHVCAKGQRHSRHDHHVRAKGQPYPRDDRQQENGHLDKSSERAGRGMGKGGRVTTRWMSKRVLCACAISG